jgi:dTDP-4-dehydrorhamnose 3,5-epimerase
MTIEPDLFCDDRGWFMESYSYQKLAKLGFEISFVQDNHSYNSTKDTLRGLHFQRQPKAQSKLVRCTGGEILDVAVDIRKGSPTYRKWVSVVLNASNKLQLFIPQGFAHGYVTLVDDTEIEYKVDNYYDKEQDRSIRFNDPSIGIEWNTHNPILSKKDGDAPLLDDSDNNFVYNL